LAEGLIPFATGAHWGPIDMLVIPVLKSGLRHQFLVANAPLRRAITISLQCFGAGELKHG
jgi:hypothetical protein